MFFVPYRKVELFSPHGVDAVVARLTTVVEPKQWLRSGAGRRPFQGTVTATSFDIQRIISYRNSFLPQIRGTLAPERGGSRISITMQLHPVVLVFLVVWSSAVFFAAALFVPAALSSRENLVPALIPLGMFCFGAVLTIAGFAFEAGRAERLLTILFDGVPADGSK